MGIDVCSSPNKEGQSLYFPSRRKDYFLLVQQQVQDKVKCLSSDFTWTFTFFQWTFFFLLTCDFLSLSHSPYYQSFMCISLIVSFWQMSFSTWQELFNKPIRSANLLRWILYFNRCFKSLFFQWTCVFFLPNTQAYHFEVASWKKVSPWCFRTYKEFDDKPNPC